MDLVCVCERAESVSRRGLKRWGGGEGDGPGVEAEARVGGLVDDAVGGFGEELGELDGFLGLDDQEPARGARG